MPTLAEKIREARKLTVEVDHMRFFARRPTVEEYGALFRDNVKDPEIARRFVHGWEGVRECDLLRGGSDEPVAFDPDVWKEAISDLPRIWQAIVAKLTAAAEEHITTAGEKEKN